MCGCALRCRDCHYDYSKRLVMTTVDAVLIAVLCVALVISLIANFVQFCAYKEQLARADEYYDDWVNVRTEINSLRSEHEDITFEHFVLSVGDKCSANSIKQMEKELEKAQLRNAALLRRLEKLDGQQTDKWVRDVAQESERKILRKPHSMRFKLEELVDDDSDMCDSDSASSSSSAVAENGT